MNWLINGFYVFLTVYFVTLIKFQLPLPKMIEYDKEKIVKELKKYYFAIPIGYESRRKLRVHNLLSSGKHVLIAGTTNYGKSNLLNVIITSLINAYPHKRVQFNLFDLKSGVEFWDYKDQKHVKNVAISPDECYIILENLVHEHKKRMEYLRRIGKKKIDGLNFPYILTIIDEYAALEENDDITLLLQQGRASGIYFIIATQYPRNDVVSKLITINCDVRISMPLKDQNASRVVLQNDMASELDKIPGRGIYQFAYDTEFQAPYIDDVKQYLPESKSKIKRSEKVKKSKKVKLEGEVI